MGAYSGLKALWLDSNGLATLALPGEDEERGTPEGKQGLRALSQLRCLYLQNNLLTRIGAGLEGLTALMTLDIR